MRTTAVAVGKIIEVDAAISLDSFIEIANSLVTELCSEDDYDAARLEMIERYLSAHFYTNRDPRVTGESAGVSASYQMATSLGFDSSMYGQTAMRLDTQGGLARLNEEIKLGKRKTVSVNWLGTERTTDEE